MLLLVASSRVGLLDHVEPSRRIKSVKSGPTVFGGYVDNANATARAITRTRHKFRTDNLAKDMILVGYVRECVLKGGAY